MSALTGKVALVTGSSRGIGRGVAERLAREGAQVIINYHSDAVAAHAVVESIRAFGGSAHSLKADIADGQAITALFDETVAHFGRLDIVIANAGYAVFKPLVDLAEAEYDRMFAVNAKGTFLCLQAALRHLSDGGRIICISTIGTILNLDGGSAYFGSKAAIEQFCRVAAREVAHRNITVNVISPGFIATDMLHATMDQDDSAQNKHLTAMTPLSRLGQPADIAGVVAFLVSDDAAWITRQNLAVDGGIIAR